MATAAPAPAARSDSTGRSLTTEAPAQPALAYGLVLSAPGLDTGVIASDGHGWPVVSITQSPAPLAISADVVEADRVELALADGTHWLRMDRRQARAEFHGPVIPADDLAHPYLWPVASVFSRWLGREALHAGAVVIDGGAWVLIGPKEAGKSTLLAAHAARGGSVLTDDLVVVDGQRAFAGPRCVDLRRRWPSAPELELRPARGGTRLRMALRPVPTSVPLRGWVFLAWGDATEAASVPPATTLARLARWRAWGQLASDEALILALAGLPAYELVRERRWESLDESLRLLAALGDA